MPKTPEEIIIEKDAEIAAVTKEKDALKAEKDVILSEKASLQKDKEILQAEKDALQQGKDAEKEAYAAEKLVLTGQIEEKDKELGTLRAEKQFRDSQKVAALSKAKEKVVCGKLQRARPKPTVAVIEPVKEP
jgi:hypothetical protein